MAFSDNDIAFLIAVGAFIIGALIYFIPTFVAAKKKSPKKTLVILLNIFLGWSVVAWVICLVLACRKPRVTEKAEASPEVKAEEKPTEVETV